MKYALVTGSTKGIGYAIADTLVKNDYCVFMNYAHDDSALLKITFPADRHCVIKADLSTIDGVNYLSAEILKKTQYLDCLVLNAGATCKKPISEIEYNDWRRVMDTNVNMPFFIIKNLYTHIKDEGSIVFIGSSLGIKPHGTSIPYGVSKAAATMLAQNLVKEFSARKIRVNVVCPGFIDTEWHNDKSSKLRKSIESKIALKQFGRPEDVAAVCLEIIRNNYVNGAIIPVDGGYDME